MDPTKVQEELESKASAREKSIRRRYRAALVVLVLVFAATLFSVGPWQRDTVYQKGYSDGNAEGYETGYREGQTEGYSDGYSAGRVDGIAVGSETGGYLSRIDGGTITQDDSPGAYNRVYVSVYGKIHSNPECSGLGTYTVMDYDEAIAKGYTLCENCY